MGRLVTCQEPTLDDILADPIFVVLMKRDGVTANQIRRLMTQLWKTRRMPFSGPSQTANKSHSC